MKLRYLKRAQRQLREQVEWLGQHQMLDAFETELRRKTTLLVVRRAVQRVLGDDRAGYLLGRVIAADWSPITEPVSGESRCVKYSVA